MPGTPTQPMPEKSQLARAHEKAVEIAGKCADPILNPRTFNYIYWVAMGTFGFRPWP